jgi:hypothetical protein
MVWSCFLIQFAILCLLIEILMSFTFIVKIKTCLLFLVIFISLLISFTYFSFTDFLAQKYLFFLESSCFTLVSSSICRSSLSIFCSACLLVSNSFHFSFFLWKILISASIKKTVLLGRLV